MIFDHTLIKNLLSIDYRNKVAVLLEEVESLRHKVCFFAPELCCSDEQSAYAVDHVAPGKEVFNHLHLALKQLSDRLKVYAIHGTVCPWASNVSSTALAVASYRMTMDDLSDSLRQLTVIENRFIQQMEAKPLYSPSPRIFRRRHEEFQMYLNDRLSNNQLKLVAKALNALFPNSGNLDGTRYHILSSTEFIPDSCVVKDWISRTPLMSETEHPPVLYAKHPYWFQSLPIMLTETAHEHSHLCLMRQHEKGNNNGRDTLIDEEFEELIAQIGLMYQLLETNLGRRSWPMRFAHVMVEEMIADITATMVFGEAYLLPCFLQLAGYDEAVGIIERKTPHVGPAMPWWSRLSALIRILYEPANGDLPRGSFVFALKSFIEDYCSAQLNLLPPDLKDMGYRLHEFHRSIQNVLVTWLRTKTYNGSKEYRGKLPLACTVWRLDSDLEQGKKRNILHLSASSSRQSFTIHSGLSKNPITSIELSELSFNSLPQSGRFTLWSRGYASNAAVPALGDALEEFINGTLPDDWKHHGTPFYIRIEDKNAQAWNYPLHKAVPLEYLIWAGYISSVIGLTDSTKTIMNSYYQLIARGMLNGFPSALSIAGFARSEGGKNHSQKLGGFHCIPYSVAAHNTRHLHFVKWRLENFYHKKEKLFEKLAHKNARWKWDQNVSYRFWVFGSFSAAILTGPGFSRRSCYHETAEKTTESALKIQRMDLGDGLGRFGEELVICPWMVFEDGVGNIPPVGTLFHLIVQIRIRTDRCFMSQRKNRELHKLIKNEAGGVPEGPVHRIIQGLEEKGLWRQGDTVFSSLGWSHLVLLLGPRTLTEAFDFKNALQGTADIDRTQTTFTTLFQEKSEPRPIDHGFCFRSVIRLGTICDNEYNKLQARLKDWKDSMGETIVENVEELPGIFDLQLTWKQVPSIHHVLEICKIGEDVAHETRKKMKRPYSPYLSEHLGALVSDVQTTVSRLCGGPGPEGTSYI